MTDVNRLRVLFDALLDVPAERWEDWFEQQGLDTATRSELRRLATADGPGRGVLDLSLGEVADTLFDARAEVAPEPAGRRIGPFRIVRRLGEGGMATVFLARREQADFDQAVALKLLRHGALSEIEQGFFRRERQVLARLSHPNIARLIDGGVDQDGVPYLAMEYVEGVSITRWCRERGSDAAARVMLVAKVARAVAAAHAALVVHRDIKPSNVLVDAVGEPRLLDFGIAKLLAAEDGERTRSGLAPMTPEYASPEQLAGETVTTASDVYSLGILLYELLSGVRPDRRAPRPPSACREQGAATSGTWTRRSRGDLDRVVMKALAEEVGRRYAGAAEFADDLERWLAREPVRAHPPSAWYRTRRFVERHRGGVLLTVLLVVGILASLALAVQQARVAREEAARAVAVRDFVVDLLRRTTPDRPEAERPDIPTLVHTAAASLPEELRDQPEIRIELLSTLGNVLRQMRDVPRSEALLREAWTGAQALPQHAPVRVMAHVEYSRTLLRKGDAEAAARVLAAVLDLPEARLPEAYPRAVVLKLAMAVEASRGHALRARELGERALAAYRRDCARGRRCAELGFMLHDLGMVRIGSGEPRSARELLRTALQHKRSAAAGPIPIAETLAGLAHAGLLLGDFEQAERDAGESVSIMRSLGNGVSQPPAAQLRVLGLTRLAQSRPDAALAPLQEALRGRESAAGSARESCARSEYRTPYARALLEAGMLQEARIEAEAALAEAADCAPDDRLMNRLLAGLVRVRVLAAAGDRSAADAYSALRPERERAAGASPMRRWMVLWESLRAAGAVGDAASRAETAAALLALLHQIGAQPSTATREAESAMADAAR